MIMLLTLYLPVFLKWNMVFKSSYLHIIQSFSMLLIYNNVQYALNYVKFLIYQNKSKNYLIYWLFKIDNYCAIMCSVILCIFTNVTLTTKILKLYILNVYIPLINMQCS